MRRVWRQEVEFYTTSRSLSHWFEASETKESWEVRDKKTGTVHHYEWDIGLPLNDANFHLKVNMLKYKETNKKGEIKRFSWVTNLPLDRDTVTLIMRAGRRRWAIEKARPSKH